MFWEKNQSESKVHVSERIWGIRGCIRVAPPILGFTVDGSGQLHVRGTSAVLDNRLVDTQPVWMLGRKISYLGLDSSVFLLVACSLHGMS